MLSCVVSLRLKINFVFALICQIRGFQQLNVTKTRFRIHIKKIVKLKDDLFNTNIIDYLWEILREINVIITCFLLETKITKDFANSSLAVLRT